MVPSGVSLLNFGVIEITGVRQRSTSTTLPALNFKLDKALETILLLKGSQNETVFGHEPS